MRNLFALIWKNQFLVLFILLEVLSLYLISRSYSYHGAIAYNTANDISGKIFEKYSNITDYFHLNRDNEILANENARLRNQLITSLNITDTNTVYLDSAFKYYPAKVISNSIHKKKNFIMINKGLKHGIKKEMGVISPTGIVGIVIGVSQNYSIAMSLLHPEMRISGEIKNSGQLVNVIWNTEDYNIGTVVDIPSHIKLNKGDTIQTSGNSLIFPAKIEIGTVSQHNVNDNKSLNTAQIEYTCLFGELNEVYVIENLMKIEQDSLIINVNEDE